MFRGINREPAKRLLKKMGLFHPTRHVYRKLSSSIKAQNKIEAEFYRPFIKPGSLCFDIGANVGKKVEVFLKLGARVVAVDPSPFCEESLRWQFGKNPDVTLVRKAISHEEGTATLYFGYTSSVASLRADWGLGTPEMPPTEVPVTTLDILISQFGRPDFCKIDVEGFEIQVLQGLSQPIPYITFEYHHNELDRAQACLDRLTSMGPVECNVTPIDEMLMIFPDWTDAPTLLDRLSKRPEIYGGDILVKSLAS